ncbi:MULTISPECIES: hypothetical protein [Enterobacter]|uniref:Uncharacterized protein n=1 Tax=Enterobacter soli TaxID=885040 RepID=A0AAW8HID5_9ENTR|nr:MULTISPECIES: hypothetical protein [Enterobacter]EFE5937912.1 hypothetical protein [Escherichia coli]EIZ2433584.1 hypothetical protein [Cronobacter sakazakii]EIZ2458198.1 hypothetical protein [Cronobacter sakazakii]EIZ9682091.1 hypothetical protein [Cronobacter sakazakii]EIZ9687722.1 hypothetical protein [Cronobacter sakazakii]
METQAKVMNELFNRVTQGALNDRSEQEARFDKILGNIDDNDVLVLTSDPFIVNKLKGNDPDSAENKESIKFIEKENKSKAFLASGKNYKAWMNENKEKMIELFSLEDASSFVAELAIPKDDRNAYYDIVDKALEAIRQKTDVMNAIKENCAYSGTTEPRAAARSQMNP